jgi:hypothetical protein
MIFETLNRRRYVREYDKDAEIPESLINSMLQKTWKVTPSKNNFMPYTVHVIGPEHQRYKELAFVNCASNETKTDEDPDAILKRYENYPPNYANILSCSYLLIFTLRLEKDPNPFQKMLIDRGHKYEAVDESRLNKLYPTASIEVGLFADALSVQCLENNLDVSFTLCFRKEIDTWKDLPFVTRKPILLMTIGKGKVYREEVIKNSEFEKLDMKPDYHKIINFVE